RALEALRARGRSPRAHLAALARGTATRRDREGALSRRARPHPGRADRGPHTAGGRRTVRDDPRHGRRRTHRDLHLAQAARGVAGNGQRELAETSAGMRPATSGTVRVGSRALRGGDPREAIAAGIAYVPEDRLHTGVAPGLSVASNLVLKSYRRPPASRGPLLLLGKIRDIASLATHS